MDLIPLQVDHLQGIFCFLSRTVDEDLKVMSRIKDALDPLHILNGKKSYLIKTQITADL